VRRRAARVTPRVDVTGRRRIAASARAAFASQRRKETPQIPVSEAIWITGSARYWQKARFSGSGEKVESHSDATPTAAMRRAHRGLPSPSWRRAARATIARSIPRQRKGMIANCRLPAYLGRAT
jgi:hypothetical protein